MMIRMGRSRSRRDLFIDHKNTFYLFVVAGDLFRVESTCSRGQASNSHHIQQAGERKFSFLFKKKKKGVTY